MTASPNWTEAWLKGQKQSLDNWTEITRRMTAKQEMAEQGMNFWKAGLDQFRDQASAMMSEESGTAYAKLLDASRSYMHLAEVFQGLLQQASESGESWREVVQQGLGEYAKLFEAGGGQDAWAEFADKWGVSKDAWDKFLNTVPGMPVNVSEAMSGTETIEGAMERLLKIPAVGFTRERQEQFQQWNELSVEYSNASMEYARFLGQANAKAMENISGRLMSFETAEDGPATMRQLYDLCVDCGEESYAGLASDEEYLAAQTRMTNALMALRKHEQEWMQDVLGMLNVPSRRELNTTIKRLQEVRRELRVLKDSVESEEDKGADDELLKQLDALKQELAELREKDKSRDQELVAVKRELEQLKTATKQKAPVKEAKAEPKEPAPVKQEAPKKTAAATSAVKKSTVKKTATKKAAPKKKTAAQKVLEIPAAAATVKKAMPKKKAAAKKAPVKKAAVKKTATKKTAPKKP